DRMDPGRTRDGRATPNAPPIRGAVPPGVDPHARGSADRGELPGALTLGRRALRAVRERGGVRRHPTSALVHRDERARGDRLQLIHQVVGPVWVDLALEVPVAPVVCHDQTVVL